GFCASAGRFFATANTIPVVFQKEVWHSSVVYQKVSVHVAEDRCETRHFGSHGAQNPGSAWRSAWIRHRAEDRTDQRRPALGEPGHSLPLALETGAGRLHRLRLGSIGEQSPGTLLPPDQGRKAAVAKRSAGMAANDRDHRPVSHCQGRGSAMKALRRFWIRVCNFVARRSGEQRLREEVEQHILFETEANLRAGMTPAQARRTALMKFGPVETVRESYHSEKGLPVMETMLQNCIFAWRMMRKSPGFTMIAALTLALGIGATSAVFSLIQGILLTPPPYQKPDQLVLVSSARADGQKMDNPRAWAQQQWMDWDKNASSLQGVAAYGWTFNFLVRNDGSQSMQGMNVSRNYVPLMGLKTVAGRGFEDADFAQGPVKAIVLGYEFWQRAFGGDPQIIGKTIRISRWSAPPTVIGIMEPGVRFLPSPGAAKEPNYDVNATVDLWIPVAPDPKQLTDPGWNVVARLRDGVSPQKAQQELAVLTSQEARSEKSFEGFVPELQTVKSEMNQDGQRILLPLLGAAVLVLLIACGNVAALLLVRGLQRQQEYAIRIAMGMGRVALLRLILTESLMLAMIGGVLGVGLAVGAVTMFKVIAVHAVPRLDAVSAGSAVLGWGLGAAILAAFAAGIIPALRVLRL